MTGIETTIAIIFSSAISAAVAFCLGYRLGGLGERELHYKEMATLFRWPPKWKR